MIIHENNVLEYTDENYAAKGGGGGRQMLTGLTKGGGGVGEILTIADKGGRTAPLFRQPLTKGS